MEPDSFLSRVCFALQQTRVSASRGTKSTLYRTRSSRKIIRVLEIRPRLIISPLTEIEWKRRRYRREDEFSDREKESRATLFTIDNFPRWRVIFPRIRSASGFSGIGFIRRSFYPSIIFFENFSEF